MNCEAMFCHLNMYSNSGKLWSKGSSNFNIAKNSFIYAFTAIKITTAILNTYAENVFYFKVCGCGKTQRNFVCSDIYPTLSFHVQLHWCKKGPYYRYRVSIETFLTFWVPIYISGSLFSVFWLHSREECQFSLHVYSNELTWFICDE